MVDNIRFIVKLLGHYNFDFLKTHKNVKGFYKSESNRSTTYKLFLFRNNVEKIDDYKARTIPSMEVTIRVGGFENEISFDNSLRKWYYGKNSMRDFNLTDFIDCIHLLSILVEVPIGNFLNAKINYLELGANLRFKAEDKCILISVFEHKELKTMSVLNNNQTVRFEGVNRSITIYDKLEEMYSNNNWKKKLLEKLSEKYFFGRFEIKIEKVSGVQFSKSNTRIIGDLILNWNKAVTYWENEMKKLEFVEFLSPPLREELGKRKMPLDDYVNYLGMKQLSSVRFKFLLDEFYKKNYSQKTRTKKRLIENVITLDKLKASQTVYNFTDLVAKKARFFRLANNNSNI